MANFLGALWGAYTDPAQFHQSLGQAMQTLQPDGLFCADNLLTWSRNLGFLDDAAFMAAFQQHAQTPPEQGIIWRTHVYTWCVRQALRRTGDLVECGCYKGTTVRIACDAVNIAQHKKKFYLYDLFEHRPGMPHHAMPEHGPQLVAQVKARFADLPQVKVIQGQVPEVLATQAPRKVAFLHLDLNQAQAEVGALEFFWDRMSPGGFILLDDYGWQIYREQKLAADQFFAPRGVSVMELPTGQGLVMA